MKKQIAYLILSITAAAASAQPCYEEVGLVCPQGQIDQCSLWNRVSEEHKCVAPKFDGDRAEELCVDKSRRQIVIIENLAYTGAPSEAESTPITATMTTITLGKNENSLRKTILTGTEENSNKGQQITLENANGDKYHSSIYGSEATLNNKTKIVCE